MTKLFAGLYLLEDNLLNFEFLPSFLFNLYHQKYFLMCSVQDI